MSKQNYDLAVQPVTFAMGTPSFKDYVSFPGCVYNHQVPKLRSILRSLMQEEVNKIIDGYKKNVAKGSQKDLTPKDLADCLRKISERKDIGHLFSLQEKRQELSDYMIVIFNGTREVRSHTHYKFRNFQKKHPQFGKRHLIEDLIDMEPHHLDYNMFALAELDCPNYTLRKHYEMLERESKLIKVHSLYYKNSFVCRIILQIENIILFYVCFFL